MYHRTRSLTVSYLHYHWGIPTKAQPPSFLHFSFSLSCAHALSHTHTQLATLNVHERSPTPSFLPHQQVQLTLPPKYLPLSPSLLHSKVISLYHYHPHTIIHSMHNSQTDLQTSKPDHIILLFSLKFSK